MARNGASNTQPAVEEANSTTAQTLVCYHCADGEDSYWWNDDDVPHSALVFAHSDQHAKALAKKQFDSRVPIESIVVKRSPDFDAFAPGPVPPLEMIKHGWWLACYECEKRVSEDGTWYDENDEEYPFDPCVTNGNLYCTPTCRDRHFIRLAKRDKRKAELIVKLYEVFPFAISPNPCEYPQPHYGNRCFVEFKVPGSKGRCIWIEGENVAHVPACDKEAWSDFQRLTKEWREATAAEKKEAP